MNRALLHIAALTLPLFGLGGMWLQADRLSRQGTEWDVPIQGYDPRDLLQGHYVQFQYDWPTGLPADGKRFDLTFEDLCLTGNAPVITKVQERTTEACPGFIRAGEAQQGRLYASRSEALRLQERLRDPQQQGVVRIRLRPDGHITPLRITFRPRPPEQRTAP
ncbi:GDYXXLXY domain-containing protein [Novosphingobium aquiterrae]|uniref:GDYXXLXY domain-containing protein n=1 Tax=Novosphingobium aquiterrae TaxID=624388 RepID=A0ABV6PJT3_9SPHN